MKISLFLLILLTSKRKACKEAVQIMGRTRHRNTYRECAEQPKAECNAGRASGPYLETVTLTLHRPPTWLCVFCMPGSVGENVPDGTRPSGTGEKMCDKSDLGMPL